MIAEEFTWILLLIDNSLLFVIDEQSTKEGLNAETDHHVTPFEAILGQDDVRRRRETLVVMNVSSRVFSIGLSWDTDVSGSPTTGWRSFSLDTVRLSKDLKNERRLLWQEYDVVQQLDEPSIFHHEQDLVLYIDRQQHISRSFFEHILVSFQQDSGMNETNNWYICWSALRLPYPPSTQVEYNEGIENKNIILFFTTFWILLYLLTNRLIQSRCRSFSQYIFI